MQHNTNVVSYGTSNFVTRRAARTYYGQQHGLSSAAVDEKIELGEIAVGPPALKPGQRCRQNAEGRYIVTELAAPAASA